MHVKNGCKDLKRYPQISRRVRDTLARILWYPYHGIIIIKSNRIIMLHARTVARAHNRICDMREHHHHQLRFMQVMMVMAGGTVQVVPGR